LHELGIANAILEAVSTEADKHRGRVRRVCVRVGELAAVNPEALRFAFDAAKQGTRLAGLILEIEISPPRYRCRDCGGAVPADGVSAVCPACGSCTPESVRGDELELAYLEVDDETRAA
jgi:hydrogenase nickel incorporation protein HypA/HybF